MQPIIQSLLDTDLYKFTMWQAMLHMHPQTPGEYASSAATQPAYPLANCWARSNAQLDHLCTLRFQREESGLPALACASSRATSPTS
jgi:nicotinate phosphoribosyltransferase